MNLSELFANPADFIDRESLVRAGFEWVGGGHLFWVASHPELPGYLIKSPPLGGDSFYLGRLARRVRNADRLRTAIAAQQFDRVVVALKWLHPLPPPFPPGRAVMVVERFELLDPATCREAYRQLDRESVRQLVELWRRPGGFEGFLDNLPITRQGQIALVDTERSGRCVEPLPSGLLPLLTPEMGEYALSLVQAL